CGLGCPSSPPGPLSSGPPGRESSIAGDRLERGSRLRAAAALSSGPPGRGGSLPGNWLERGSWAREVSAPASRWWMRATSSRVRAASDEPFQRNAPLVETAELLVDLARQEEQLRRVGMIAPPFLVGPDGAGQVPLVHARRRQHAVGDVDDAVVRVGAFEAAPE